MATFAKCFGGGLPIGITCFNKKIENKISKIKKNVFLEVLFQVTQYLQKLD